MPKIELDSIYVSQQQYDKIKRHADNAGISVSYWLRLDLLDMYKIKCSCCEERICYEGEQLEIDLCLGCYSEGCGNLDVDYNTLKDDPEKRKQLYQSVLMAYNSSSKSSANKLEQLLKQVKK